MLDVQMLGFFPIARDLRERSVRRKEFSQNGVEHAEEILDSARYGHLVTLDEDGQAETRPINYARLGDEIYFHCSPRGALAARAGTTALLAVEDTLTWMPSYFRHAEMACPATTYYRSVQVRGSLRAVSSAREKAEALAAFMRRYQPEGGHLPIESGSDRYDGPLKTLCVLALRLFSWTCKVKMGQHLTPQMRAHVHDQLLERNDPGDADCAREMRRANADLGPISAYPECEDDVRTPCPAWPTDVA